MKSFFKNNPVISWLLYLLVTFIVVDIFTSLLSSYDDFGVVFGALIGIGWVYVTTRFYKFIKA